jgi:hypothetical protein
MTHARIKASPRAFDWVWLACDRDDRVAAFVTAGAGPIPTAVLDSNLPVEDGEALIRSLAATTVARSLLAKGDVTSFMALAQRGVFVYDWQGVHSARMHIHSYELVAVPDTPARFDSLPDELAKLSRVVRFDKVSFVDEKAIDTRLHTECLADYQ